MEKGVSAIDRLTWEYKDGGIFVDQSEVNTYECDDVIMHTGNAIRKLSKYEDLDERLEVEFGSNISIFELVDLYLKHIEEVDKEPLKGFRLLTNDDALEYDEWKGVKANGIL